MESKKRVNVRLTMQEDFELTKWLHAHEMRPGETITDLLKLAQSELKNSRLNYNHLQTRLQTFNIELIPAPERDPAKRIEALERALYVLSSSYSDLLGALGHAIPNAVIEILGRYAGK